MKKLILGFLVVNLLAACSSAPTKEKPAENAAEPAATTPAAETPATGTAGSADVSAQTLDNAAAPKAEAAAPAQTTSAADEAMTPPKNSVFFPFDVDAIQDGDKDVIQAHGAYLHDHPERKARVEGNADERGSSEYNLALGQRRANNTRKALVLSGAHNDQIETLSYGEERPRATEHNEAAWSQNRRADIIYK